MQSADEILETIDHYSGLLPFLSNDGRAHLTDARLTVFRSEQHWAVFFEFIEFMDIQFSNWVIGVGNCFERELNWAEELNRKELFQEVPEAPWWGEDDGEWKADRAHFSILLDGQRRDFEPIYEDYEDAGIYFQDDNTGPGSLEPGYLLRLLCCHLHHSFFASEAELRSLLDHGADAPIFLQTSHWKHPVWLVDSDHEEVEPGDRFRDNPCFQILARAIATGDLTEWNGQDTRTFNTHWQSLEAIRRMNESFGERWKSSDDTQSGEWFLSSGGF